MLIEFSVSNYRSFREKQTFSMVAAPRMRKKENVFSLDVKGEKLPGLLKVAAIYGPNASGKSNLLRALEVIQLLAKSNLAATSAPIPVLPFRFDNALSDQPSTFEWHFVQKGLRYQFNLAATPERIVEEQLMAFPSGKDALLYRRVHKASGEQYTFGETLEGGSALHETWKKLTGPRTLFIAQAVANSSEEINQLRVPFEWLREGVVVIQQSLPDFAFATQKIARDNPSFAKSMSSFLNDLDIPISGLRFTEDEKPIHPETQSHKKMMLAHKTLLGEADFDFDEESEGTKGLIGFWLPWHIVTHEAAPYRILVVDELDSSLHPEIVVNLVRKHLEYQQSAQLIFTTHDTHLMDTRLLRRDQIWLTERDVNGATQLRSVHEFEGRESEDVEKRYYEGRYRALPILRK